MKAARAPRVPEKILPGHVDAERASRWPELRARGRQTKGLRKRIEEAANQATAEHIGRWFYQTAHPVSLEAYDSGIPVFISGTASADSGFQVKWHAGVYDHGTPWINRAAAVTRLTPIPEAPPFV